MADDFDNLENIASEEEIAEDHPATLPEDDENLPTAEHVFRQEPVPVDLEQPVESAPVAVPAPVAVQSPDPVSIPKDRQEEPIRITTPERPKQIDVFSVKPVQQVKPVEKSDDTLQSEDLLEPDLILRSLSGPKREPRARKVNLINVFDNLEAKPTASPEVTKQPGAEKTPAQAEIVPESTPTKLPGPVFRPSPRIPLPQAKAPVNLPPFLANNVLVSQSFGRPQFRPPVGTGQVPKVVSQPVVQQPVPISKDASLASKIESINNFVETEKTSKQERFINMIRDILNMKNTVSIGELNSIHSIIYGTKFVDRPDTQEEARLQITEHRTTAEHDPEVRTQEQSKQVRVQEQPKRQQEQRPVITAEMRKRIELEKQQHHETKHSGKHHEAKRQHETKNQHKKKK